MVNKTLSDILCLQKTRIFAHHELELLTFQIMSTHCAFIIVYY